ncbi:non-ribosomal peptide synthetase, partial [Pseudoalteromonas sp. MMG012]|uniref:non-ribosomal peptide synthetase n=1 Tax=Pseudoalteromonas sp. MMG012 TaxID=2822686 RepID=UPI001B3A6147
VTALPEKTANKNQPTTQTEAQLLTIWSQILNQAEATIDTRVSFFTQGGHSLRAVKMQTAIKKTFTKTISLQTIFTAQSIYEIAKYLDKHTDFTIVSEILPQQIESQTYKLSYAQQRLWFIDNMNQGSTEYHITSALRVCGKFNLDIAQQAFSQIIARHEVLRSVFVKNADGEVSQRVNDHHPFSIRQVTLKDLTGEPQNKALEQEIKTTHNACFDLAHDLLLRVTCVHLAHEDVAIVLTMHHIASDAWSLGILVNEFSMLYSSLKNQEDACLVPLPVQYRDYAHWQHQSDMQSQIIQQLAYWQQQLSDLPSVHQIPLDYSRQGIKSNKGKRARLQLEPSLAEAINNVAKRFNITPFMLCHGALSLLLSKYSYEHDIVIGTPVANRTRQELEPLIGFFVNTLVLRSDTRNRTVADFFAHIRSVNLAAQDNQDVPFEQIVDTCCQGRSTQYTPLFQIMLNMNNTESTELSISDLDVDFLSVEALSCKYDLEFAVQLNSGNAMLTLQFDSSLFEYDTANAMLKQYQGILKGITEINHDDDLLSDLGSTSQGKSNVRFSEVHSDIADTRIDALIYQQAIKSPDSIALKCGQTIQTYAELMRQADELASYLTVYYPRHACIGICLGRSEILLSTVLAVLRADMTYVPMEPSYPQQRLATIVENASVAAVLTSPQWQQNLNVENISLICVNSYKKVNRTVMLNTPTNPVAYIIHTSGSTGTPKGIEVLHRGLTNYLKYAQKRYLNTVIGQSIVSSTLSFDATLTSLLTPLICGKTVTVLFEDNTLDDLYQCLCTHSASLFKVTPAHLQALCALNKGHIINSQHTLVIGGEQFTGQLLSQCQAWLPNSTFINEYGPSETVVGCSDYPIYPDQKEDHELPVPIGRAIDNTHLYILDRHQQRTPQGGIGELYIAGAGVAKGYVRQRELTDDKFVSWQGQRVYRSGDLMRQLADGNYTFIGRADDQVKLRGYRIETAEIEVLAKQLGQIEQAVAKVIELENASAQLVLYIVALSEYRDHEALIELVKSHL